MRIGQLSRNGEAQGGPGLSRNVGRSILRRVTSTLIDNRRGATAASEVASHHLHFDNVSKFYRVKTGDHCVLDSISIDFPRGRNIAILGKNGAGKSTLMRLIAGSEAPTSGTVRRKTRISWPLGLGAGVHPALSAMENSRFIARIYNTDPRMVEETVRDFADIGSYFDMPVRTLSSGMRAKVNFGLSMAIQFDCYLIDELTAVGDARFRQKCKDAFDQRLNSADVIMVSHEAATVKSFCDMAAILKDGKLSFYDSLDEATEIYRELA